MDQQRQKKSGKSKEFVLKWQKRAENWWKGLESGKKRLQFEEMGRRGERKGVKRGKKDKNKFNLVKLMKSGKHRQKWVEKQLKSGPNKYFHHLNPINGRAQTNRPPLSVSGPSIMLRTTALND